VEPIFQVYLVQRNFCQVGIIREAHGPKELPESSVRSRLHNYGARNVSVLEAQRVVLKQPEYIAETGNARKCHDNGNRQVHLSEIF
jgi:hypothetical protein